MLGEKQKLCQFGIINKNNYLLLKKEKFLIGVKFFDARCQREKFFTRCAARIQRPGPAVPGVGTRPSPGFAIRACQRAIKMANLLRQSPCRR
jgi:hypothetical protein